MDACVAELRQALVSADIGPERSAQFEKQLEDIAADLKFLRVGNGIHNIHYASSLTNGLVQRISELCDELDVGPMEVKLPAELETHEGARS